MPNRLADSSSPYLRQHKDNPVDWFPWCEEALAKAKAEDKPIFLSVGYSACHWCHVMEHESFESEATAEILNEHFVSIKVDREERPDIDQIYMQAVQMLTGSGGWPMSVFMTHDGTPFFAGTYWPPKNKHGRPGFDQVLLAVADTWNSRREEVLKHGREITAQLQVACRGPDVIGDGLDPQWISEADAWLVRNHDAAHGGFGKRPKFPHAIDLSLLVELEQQRPNPTRQKVITTTLDRMARGGIYDHLGGGFARYSVDAKWLVPHFEKMLYDNALLACTYADAYRLWGNEEYAQVLRETLDYVIRDMTNEFGGFCSTEDADSEGVEGKFYVWSLDEVVDVLGAKRSQQFCDCYDVTAEGNFEESNILNLPKSIPQFAELRGLELSELKSQLAEDRRKLFERRCERVRPGLDDKVLLSWNALMITAMVRGYRALGDGRYLAAAKRGVDFVVRHMRRDDGGLWHTWRGGTPSLDAYLDDVSYFIDALTELFQVESEEQTLTLAIEAAEAMLANFEDPQSGFFFTAETHQRLIARSKDLADSSVPSGNAMAATALIKLSRLTGREDFLAGARSALMACSGVMAESPQAAAQALRASLLLFLPSKEFVLFEQDKTGEGPAPTHSIVVRQQLLQRFEVNAITVVVAQTATSDRLQQVCPLVAERMAVRNKPTLYVCENSVCRLPLVGETLLEFLAQTTHEVP